MFRMYMYVCYHQGNLQMANAKSTIHLQMYFIVGVWLAHEQCAQIELKIETITAYIITECSTMMDSWILAFPHPFLRRHTFLILHKVTCHLVNY